MLHMPRIIHSSPPLVADTFQMAKANNDFHFEWLKKFTFAPQVTASHPAGRIDNRNRTEAALASLWQSTGEDPVGRSF